MMIDPKSQSEVARRCVRFVSVIFMHLNTHNIDDYYCYCYYNFQYAFTLIWKLKRYNERGSERERESMNERAKSPCNIRMIVDQTARASKDLFIINDSSFKSDYHIYIFFLIYSMDMVISLANHLFAGQQVVATASDYSHNEDKYIYAASKTNEQVVSIIIDGDRNAQS